MRLRLLLAALAACLLLAGPVRADSHDAESSVPGPRFEDTNDWGDLDDGIFGGLVSVAWLCGNFSQAFHSFHRGDLAPDFLNQILALAAQGGAGRAQLHIIEEVFDLGKANAVQELERREWFMDPESELYKNYFDNLMGKLFVIRRMCVDYRK